MSRLLLAYHGFQLVFYTGASANGLRYRFISYLQDVGFYKEREIAFPHKQAALMKIRREGWEAPVL